MGKMLNSVLKTQFARIVVFLLGLILSSCTVVTTGTRTPLNQSNLSKIKKIGILVKKEENFSVRLSFIKGPSPLGVLFPFVLGVEAGVRLSIDKKLEEEFKPILGHFDPKKLMNDRLHQSLQLAKVFHTVVSINEEEWNVLERKELDGILEITLKEWGLYPCVSASDQAVVGFNMHGRILLLEHGSIAWERNELYLDGDCYFLEDFRSREELLRDVLIGAIGDLSEIIVNEVIFP